MRLLTRGSAADWTEFYFIFIKIYASFSVRQSCRRCTTRCASYCKLAAPNINTTFVHTRVQSTSVHKLNTHSFLNCSRSKRSHVCCGNFSNSTHTFCYSTLPLLLHSLILFPSYFTSLLFASYLFFISLPVDSLLRFEIVVQIVSPPLYSNQRHLIPFMLL